MSINVFFFFFKQKTAYEMCGRDWSSDVCSSDLTMARWRSQNQIASIFMAFRHVGGVDRGQHLNPLLTVDVVQVGDRPMHVHRLIGKFGQLTEYALGFAKGVAEENGGAIAVGLPPVINPTSGFFSCVPFVNR